MPSACPRGSNRAIKTYTVSVLLFWFLNPVTLACIKTPPRFEFASWNSGRVVEFMDLPQNIVPPPFFDQAIARTTFIPLTSRPKMLESTVARLGKRTFKGGHEVGFGRPISVCALRPQQHW